ncbi:unnamed protein product [Paramecium sonneborni]|uniref:Uncharacterized protein n=1 Tax=Paramecium sonneborni TaxID=65129 RepID=A0A8S1R5I9_9CILI|nr:unnamed protein product [Paramecium sonneborni]
MSYTQGTQVFEYKGQQYMLQEFMDRQKIRREDYIVNLKEAVEFKQLFCILNPKLRIKEPLVLSKCSQKNIVDFQSFYDELKKIDFDIENIGLTLCKCLSCNQNPIKTITGNIHFHEPFYEALNKFSKIDNQTKLEKFTYKFEKTEEESYVVRELIQINNPKIKVVQQPKQMDAQNLINVKGNEGFVDLMNDEEYQKFFGATQIQGFAYKAQGMQQNIGVLQIDYGKDGIRANVEEAVEKLNQNANSQLKQFHFNVVGMQVQLKNDVFNQNKGEFKFQK